MKKDKDGVWVYEHGEVLVSDEKMRRVIKTVWTLVGKPNDIKMVERRILAMSSYEEVVAFNVEVLE